MTFARVINVLYLALVACGGGATSDSDAGDAGSAATRSLDAQSSSDAKSRDAARSTNDAAQGADGSGVVDTGCNTLVSSGAPVDLTHAQGAAPTPLGGAIQQGQYNLTSYVAYDGQSGTTKLGTHGTLSVSGNTLQMIEASTRLTATWRAGASTLYIEESCPSQASLTESYTAANDQLIFYQTNQSNAVIESVYTKQ